MLKLETEAQIQSAIDDGNLSESRYLDVKSEVGSTDRSRKETAKDLSSFAIDGGMLLIGVAENKADRAFQLSPIALDGAMERLEQVADARIDPPLFIRVSEIPTLSDPKMGYLSSLRFRLVRLRLTWWMASILHGLSGPPGS